MNSFYDEDELKQLGFRAVGDNVLISKKTSIYGAENISIGNNVRIDDFCILSGSITIGNYVHIAAFCALFGGGEGIVFMDFSGISSRVSIYAASDDYSGETMTNPTVPEKYKKVTQKQVVLNKHVIIGSGATVLPGVTLGEGTAVGAMSLVNKSTNPWGVYMGNPARLVIARSKNLLLLEEELLAEEGRKVSILFRIFSFQPQRNFSTINIIYFLIINPASIMKAGLRFYKNLLTYV